MPPSVSSANSAAPAINRIFFMSWLSSSGGTDEATVRSPPRPGGSQASTLAGTSEVRCGQPPTGCCDDAAVEHRTLGDSQLEISVIALGSWLTYGAGIGREQTEACTRA